MNKIEGVTKLKKYFKFAGSIAICAIALSFMSVTKVSAQETCQSDAEVLVKTMQELAGWIVTTTRTPEITKDGHIIAFHVQAMIKPKGHKAGSSKCCMLAGGSCGKGNIFNLTVDPQGNITEGNVKFYLGHNGISPYIRWEELTN